MKDIKSRLCFRFDTLEKALLEVDAVAVKKLADESEEYVKGFRDCIRGLLDIMEDKVKKHERTTETID